MPLFSAYFRSFWLTDGTHSGSQQFIFYDHQYQAKTHAEWFVARHGKTVFLKMGVLTVVYVPVLSFLAV